MWSRVCIILYYIDTARGCGCGHVYVLYIDGAGGCGCIHVYVFILILLEDVDAAFICCEENRWSDCSL